MCNIKSISLETADGTDPRSTTVELGGCEISSEADVEDVIGWSWRLPRALLVLQKGKCDFLRFFLYKPKLKQTFELFFARIHLAVFVLLKSLDLCRDLHLERSCLKKREQILVNKNRNRISSCSDSQR